MGTRKMGQRLLCTSMGSLKVLESLVSNQTHRVDTSALTAGPKGSRIAGRHHH